MNNVSASDLYAFKINIYYHLKFNLIFDVLSQVEFKKLEAEEKAAADEEERKEDERRLQVKFSLFNY